MKLKSIHILIIIAILGGILLFINRKEKYADIANVVILNPINLPKPSISGERNSNTFCDESNPDNHMCLDVFKITHPRIVYDVNNLI
jgi:hypothetical protein